MTEAEGNAKVLIVSLHHPELMRGGAQRIAYELFQGLQNEPGIEPVLLASTDMAYPALYKSGACITGFDQRPNEFLFLPQEYDGAWHRTSSVRLIDAYCEFLEHHSARCRSFSSFPDFRHRFAQLDQASSS